MSAVDWVCQKISLESASEQLSAITISRQRVLSSKHDACATLPPAVGYRLSPDHFQKFKRMPAPDWAQKNLCIILPNQRTASPEFFSCARTRRLLSRHTCLVRSPRLCVQFAREIFPFCFPKQKRRSYR